MNLSTIRRKKSFCKRLKWKNISLFFLSILMVFMLVFHIEQMNDYQIEYIEYRMQKGDTLFTVVQDMNTFVPWGWDTRHFVTLTKKVNRIEDSSQIREGQILLIPIAKPKE